MAYDVSDFKACMFNPLSKKIFDNNPNLKSIVPATVTTKGMLGEPTEQVVSMDEAELLMRYTILLFDPKSPLFSSEKDLLKRKEVAADLAKLNDDFLYRESVFNCNNPLVVTLAVGYLMHFAKNKYWAAICACEYTFWESITKLMEPINDKDSKTELESVDKKGKIKGEMDADINRLEDYYAKFFGDDTLLMEKAKPKLTPEGMAKMFK